MNGVEFLGHDAPRSVVIHNFNTLGIRVLPGKTHAPLIVDADAVLPSAVARQRLEPVAWRNSQVIQASGHVQLLQFAAGDRFDISETTGHPALEQSLRVFAFEGLDRHAGIVTRYVDNVKRDYFWYVGSEVSFTLQKGM